MIVTIIATTLKVDRMSKAKSLSSADNHPSLMQYFVTKDTNLVTTWFLLV